MEDRKGWMTLAKDWAESVGLKARVIGHDNSGLALRRSTEAEVTIDYSCNVYDSHYFTGRRTDKPYRVSSHDHTVRQATVQKAVDYARRALEKLDERNRLEAERLSRRLDARQARTDALKAQGLTLSVRAEYIATTSSMRGHTVEHEMVSHGRVHGTVKQDNDKLLLADIYLNVALTADQFKRLAEFIDSPEFQTMAC